MTPKGSPAPRRLLSGILLTIGAVVLAWLCVRSATVRALPTSSAVRAQIAPNNADTVLEDATQALITTRGGVVPTATLAAVRRAAQAAPLDARPYLVTGHQQLHDGQLSAGIATLEAAQRLDPRDRLVHLLLLDSYLKAGRYDDVAAQFAVATRLVGQARAPIAAALAAMIKMPAMYPAARRALQADPALEQAVLITLAQSDSPPAAIFALASAAARRDAGVNGGWGPVLINRLVNEERYAEARSVWRNVYRLSAAQVAPLVFDGGFRRLTGSPPFNWTLTSASLGAADIRDQTLAVTYYGRDTGELARQTLMLAPGAYRFAVTVEGAKASVGPSLAWSLRCAGAKSDLMTLPATGTESGEGHRIVAAFTVPSDCPAQQLTLTGTAGEFAAPINLVFRDLDVRPAAGAVR
ncbi:tetratricopeptide repeat protein [Sphingomonas sp. PB4P5]|uniref:tetratricopeptide repeat protein n=1 Tax=Parasphingomonas puruogangriensis TaxID=3096155 RepID=UPI002FC94E94